MKFVSELKDRRILIGVTGGIAAYKTCSLVSMLVKAQARVRVIMTRSATGLVTNRTFQALSSSPVLTDEHYQTGNGMAHIDYERWGEVLCVAPCTANVLGKLANGIADDALTTLSMAFQGCQILAPAMNTGMWQKGAVQRNIATLKNDGYIVLSPGEGRLACGDFGAGRMPEPEDLLEEIKKRLP